jgi:hypothetical protein
MEVNKMNNKTTEWEYCELVWKPEGISIIILNVSENQNVRNYDAKSFHKTIAQLGLDGWELTGVMSSPTGAHEYFYYFKRPIS